MSAFLDLHRPGDPLLLPNAWDVGSARLFAALGFAAVATTSSGAAAAVGRRDGDLGRDAALAHVASLVAASPVPVTADLEDGFGDDPDQVASTVGAARRSGLAGLSVEDARAGVVLDRTQAVERVAAAAAAAHAGADPIVLTARAENFLYDRPDLDDTVERLRAYAAAGADVLYAPGLTTLDQVRTVVAAVDRPVNVLAVPGLPPVPDLAAVGVARVSVGGAFAFLAYGAAVEAAAALLGGGRADWLDAARRAAAAVRPLLATGAPAGGDGRG